MKDASIIIALRRQHDDAHLEEALSAVLYSCSRAGLYKEALSVYNAMTSANVPVKDQYKRLVLKAFRIAGQTDLHAKYSAAFRMQSV